MTMKKLPMDAEYRDIVTKAKELGINYIGVKKDELLKMINEKIDQINSSEAIVAENTQTEEVFNEAINEEVVNPENNEEATTAEETVEEQQEPVSPAKAAAQKSAEKQKQKRERQLSKKWYEEPGAFPYKKGDIVKIIGGKDLIGRLLYVLEPSAKKDMMKGRLIHPVTGQLQKTVIAIAFERIQLEKSTDEATNEVEETVETPQAEKQEVSVNEEESIIAGSEEEVDIPEMNTEEETEEDKAI